MINKTFILKHSWINKIHPGLRVIAAVLCTLSVALSYKFETLIILLISATLIVFTINLKAKFVLKGLTAATSFLLFIWLVLPFSYRPETADNFRAFGAMEAGGLLALKITLKAVSISLFSMALIGTMELGTLGYSLRFIRIPKKMVTLILLTYRYIFLIRQEYVKISQGIKVRGFQAKTNKHTYKTYSYVIGVLFIRALERAEKIHNAMICRNFSGDFFILKTYTFNWQSNIFTITILMLITIALFYEIKI